MAVQLNESQVKVFFDRYALRDRDGNLLEHTVEEMWRRVARAVAEAEKEEEQTYWEQKFYELLEDFKFVPGGRILHGAGNPANVTLYNCFVLPRPQDSWDGIDETLHKMTLLMKAGGGVGIDLATLRPRGAVVKSVNGRSSGAVSLGEIYSQRTGQIQQGGSRRGALMLSLPVWHPDVEEFITIKRELDRTGNSVHYTYANISIRVTDAFMKAVEEDADWDLIFPDTTHSAYHTQWDGDIDKWIANGWPIIKYKTVKARELLRKIVENNWAAAEPGVIYWDVVKRHHNGEYLHPVVGTNPCLTGDTLIATNRGLVPITELVGKTFAVAVDKRLGTYLTHSPYIPGVQAFMTGVKPVYRLETQEGYTIRLTEDHKVMTKRGWVEACHLKPGDEVYIHDGAGAFGDKGTLDEGRLLGWFVAAGYFITQSDGQMAAVLDFDVDKHGLTDVFNETVVNVLGDLHNGSQSQRVASSAPAAIQSRITTVRSTHFAHWLYERGLMPDSKLMVPELILTGSENMQRGFLQALFSEDKTKLHTDHGMLDLRFASTSVDFLKQVQLLLLNFGIQSRLYENRHGFNQIHREIQVYHELAINDADLLEYNERIGLLGIKHHLLHSAPSFAKQFGAKEKIARVVSIQPDGVEAVYDLTVPVVHAFSANGVVVHNCAEEPLSGYSVCLLGHINLSRYVKNGDVAWDELVHDIYPAVRFLDNVVDISKYPLEDNLKIQKTERRIGLGTMGLAHMLIKLGLRYGSDEAIKFVDKLYRTIAYHAYMASIELAKVKGAFPGFQYDGFTRSVFVQQMMREFPDIADGIKQYGIRNMTLLTQAPTGTGSLLANTSSGIEPVYRFVIRRSDRLGERVIEDAVYSEYVKSGLIDPDHLPSYFVTAKDVKPIEHIKMQAAVQKWVDASISKTINCPEHTTVEELEKLYIYAWKSGVKSFTVFRDNSRAHVIADATDEKAKMYKERTTSSSASSTSSVTTMSNPHISSIEVDSHSMTANISVHATPSPVAREPAMLARPKMMRGYAYVVPTPFGNVTVDIHVDEKDEPIEVFVSTGAVGSDIMADAVALGMLVSTVLRLNSPVSRVQRLQIIADKLRNIGYKPSLNKERAATIPAAIAKAIDKFLSRTTSTSLQNIESPAQPTLKLGIVPSQDDAKDLCPQCGFATLRREGGCVTCDTCGFSKCG